MDAAGDSLINPGTRIHKRRPALLVEPLNQVPKAPCGRDDYARDDNITQITGIDWHHTAPVSPVELKAVADDRIELPELLNTSPDERLETSASDWVSAGHFVAQNITESQLPCPCDRLFRPNPGT